MKLCDGIIVLKKILLFILVLLPVSLSANAYWPLSWCYTSSNEVHIVECDSDYTGVVTIPAEINGRPVTKIYEDAFNYSSHVTHVEVPASVSTLTEYHFKVMWGLESITVAEEHESYQTVDGVLFSREMDQLISYPRAKPDESYVMPETCLLYTSDAADE